MGVNGFPRGNLESCGNLRRAKSIRNGFGVVRFLTNASQNDVLSGLAEGDIDRNVLKPVKRLHLTVLGFVKMTKREQAAFNAGFDVARLEQKLEDEVCEESPRVAFSVELDRFESVDSLIYCPIEEPSIALEQVQLAGQVALRGISPQRINSRTIPPHIAIGYDQTGDVEEAMGNVQEVLGGTSVALQRWSIYPERYA